MTGCARCGTTLEPGDLRCAVCALPTPTVATRAPARGAKIFRCESCGAALAYDARAGAPRCAFCSAIMRVEEPVDPVEVAELVAPFRVAREVAHGALRAWLGSLGFFRPSDLVAKATLENLQPIQWCAWIVEADAWVSWTADSDAGSGRSDWAPHGGQTAMRFERLVVPASRGLSVAECGRLTASYDFSALAPPRGETSLVEQFDVQRSAARPVVVAAIERTAAARLAAERVIPGSRYRNVKVAVLLRALRTTRVALPAYVLAYRYKNRSYRAVVHGQDASCAFGEAPLSWAKITLVIAAGLVALAVLLAIVAAVLAR